MAVVYVDPRTGKEYKERPKGPWLDNGFPVAEMEVKEVKEKPKKKAQKKKEDKKDK